MKTTNLPAPLAGVKPGHQLRSQRLLQGLAGMGFELEFSAAAESFSIALGKGGTIATDLSLDQVEDFWSLSTRAMEAHLTSPTSRARNRGTVVCTMMENYVSNRAGIVEALRRLEEDPTGAGNKAVAIKATHAARQARTRDAKGKSGKLGMPPMQDIPMPPVREPRSKLGFPRP